MANDMTKYKAEQLLGLTGSYDFKAYTKAYRAAVKENHPDMGGSEDKMIEINAAKEYLATYFEDDKDAVITCSKSDTASAGSTSHASANATSNHSAYNDFAADVRNQYASNGSENDAPFTTFNYTSKPQGTWNDDDWNAFKHFQPTPSYDNGNYYVEKLDSWAPNSPVHGKGHLADAGNIDVSRWTDKDWYYYWFTNARHPRTDGKVYVRLAADAFYGPYAERSHAERTPGFWNTSRKYQNPTNPDWVNTPYGRVCVMEGGPNGYYTLEKSGWSGNVGVPFAYAKCANYDLWLEMNLAAQREAANCPAVPVAETSGPKGYGWTGLEFLEPEDCNAAWIHELGLEDAVANKRSTASDTSTTKPFNVGFEDTWTNAVKNNPGYGEKMASAVFGDEDSKRDSVDGAPAWYNALNSVVNHFPSRILFWMLAGIYANMTLAAGPSGEEYLVLMLLAILTFVNVVFPILAPVRWFLRWVADTSLAKWSEKKAA